MNKRIISIILCISIVLVSSMISTENKYISAIEIGDLKASGIMISKEEFKDIYSGPESIRKDPSDASSILNISLNILMLKINDNNLQLDFTIGDSVVLSTSGSLFNSRRKFHNNLVAELDLKNALKVLFFEIVLDDLSCNLLYNKSLEFTPHIKFYLMDENDSIYLFEFRLPEKISSVNISTEDECAIESDFIWFTEFADGDLSKITNANIYKSSTDTGADSVNKIIKDNIKIASCIQNENILSKPVSEFYSNKVEFQMTPAGVNIMSSTNPVMWGAKYIYQKTIIVGYDEVKYLFYPYGYIRGSNVSTAGNATWSASLEVSESTQVKMIGSHLPPTISYGINRLSAKNAKFSFVSGNYTHMLRTMVDGSVRETNFWGNFLRTTGYTIAAQIMKKTFSAVPYGKTALEILDWLSLINTPHSSEITLGGSGITLFSNYTSGAKLELASKYSLNKYTEVSGGGHKIVMQVDLTRTSNNSNITTGSIRINYDVYYNIYTFEDSHQVQKNFQYSGTAFNYS